MSKNYEKHLKSFTKDMLKELKANERSDPEKELYEVTPVRTLVGGLNLNVKHLSEHVNEHGYKHPEQIAKYAADVANYAMMISQNAKNGRRA